MPNIDKVENKDDALVYEATVEVYPEVEVKALDTLTVERKTSEIQDKDVDQMIENLQKQRQTRVETKGMAKKTCRSLLTSKEQSMVKNLKAVLQLTLNWS